MTINKSSTYLPVFFGQPIYMDYENKAYLDQNLIKLSITIDSIETIFEWDGLSVGDFQNCV